LQRAALIGSKVSYTYRARTLRLRLSSSNFK
jgi:hypothetical protein